jgi:hypothetical protein
MYCPECESKARTEKFTSRIYPKSPPFWRWVCACGWWSREWYDNDPSAQPTNNETRG